MGATKLQWEKSLRERIAYLCTLHPFKNNVSLSAFPFCEMRHTILFLNCFSKKKNKPPHHAAGYSITTCSSVVPTVCRDDSEVSHVGRKQLLPLLPPWKWQRQQKGNIMVWGVRLDWKREPHAPRKEGDGDDAVRGGCHSKSPLHD